MTRGIRQKTKNYLLARNINTADMQLIAVQHSRRTQRPGKKNYTKYVYQYGNTQDIYWNRHLNASYYIPMGFDDTEMARYYDVFVRPPLTATEEEWLNRNDFRLV